ncbi:MAG: multiheme c-type cytochrome [Planctomycetota bacterium]|nr:multiheme c-type cytochrome [Planctomycetota bacterium]
MTRQPPKWIARCPAPLWVVVLSWALLPWSPVWSADAVPPLPPPPAPENAAQSRNSSDYAIGSGSLKGAGSCSAANCHGGVGGEGFRARDARGGLGERRQSAVDSTTAGGQSPDCELGTEYGVWLEKDPHAIAFSTLFSQRSVRIAKKLGLPAAHEAKVCLACHATMTDSELESFPEQLSAHDDKRLIQLRDGVSCESCHGAADGWLEPHKQLNWRTSASINGLGFVDARKIEVRADACVKCHVGSPGRDVDHDLIAAGHPRLYFELAAYQAKLPRHWSRKQDVRLNSPLDARLWLVGQTVSADAALQLLEYRATKKPAGTWLARSGKGLAAGTAPWPEFAELSCFACHHDLVIPSWRQKQPFTKNFGDAPWGIWQYSAVERLAGVMEKEGSQGIGAELAALQTTMRQPLPDRNLVAKQVSVLRDRIGGMRHRFSSGIPIPDDAVTSFGIALTDLGTQSLPRFGGIKLIAERAAGSACGFRGSSVPRVD